MAPKKTMPIKTDLNKLPTTTAYPQDVRDVAAVQSDLPQQDRAKPQGAFGGSSNKTAETGTLADVIAQARNTPKQGSPLYDPADDYTADGQWTSNDGATAVPDWAQGELKTWTPDEQNAWTAAWQNGDEVGWQEIRNAARERHLNDLQNSTAAAPGQPGATLPVSTSTTANKAVASVPASAVPVPMPGASAGVMAPHDPQAATPNVALPTSGLTWADIIKRGKDKGWAK